MQCQLSLVQLLVHDYEKENLHNLPSKFFTIFQNLVILVCVGAGGGDRMKKDSWQCVVSIVKLLVNYYKKRKFKNELNKRAIFLRTYIQLSYCGVGWNDFEEKNDTLSMLCQIVVQYSRTPIPKCHVLLLHFTCRIFKGFTLNYICSLACLKAKT